MSKTEPRSRQPERAAAAEFIPNNASDASSLQAAIEKLNQTLPRENRFADLPELAEFLLARGETVGDMRDAWRACKERAKNPPGAFLMWMRKGYLPRESTHTDDDGDYSGPPPGMGSNPGINSSFERLKRLQAEEAGQATPSQPAQQSRAQKRRAS